jgi:hypothetical protein
MIPNRRLRESRHAGLRFVHGRHRGRELSLGLGPGGCVAGCTTDSSADRSEMGQIDRSRRRRGCAGSLWHKFCTTSLDKGPLLDGCLPLTSLTATVASLDEANCRHRHPPFPKVRIAAGFDRGDHLTKCIILYAKRIDFDVRDWAVMEQEADISPVGREKPEPGPAPLLVVLSQFVCVSHLSCASAKLAEIWLPALRRTTRDICDMIPTGLPLSRFSAPLLAVPVIPLD